jgi:hypothetical protein
MKLIDKLLRLPLAPEVLALLEKIDSIDSIYDASYQPIERLLHNEGFSRYERRILQKSLNKVTKRHAYTCAMHVVIKNELPTDPDRVAKASILTRAGIIQAAQHEFNKAYLQTQPMVSVHSTAIKPANPYEMYRQDDNNRF